MTVLYCTLCKKVIRDNVYVDVSVPTWGGSRREPRHLACDIRLRRIERGQLPPSAADGEFIRRLTPTVAT